MTRSRQASHIIPGPSWGYWNSSISEVTCAAVGAPADGVAHGAAERQALDPLGRPVGRHLVGGHAPHLLGVGLEEHPVQALPEA